MRPEQLQRYLRYGLMSLAHMTPRKLVNLAAVEWKLASGNPDVSGLSPHTVFVDISNGCNLRCPLCQTGRRKNVQRRNVMTAENYARIIEPVKDRLLQVFLFNWGEPFLNPSIYDILRYNADNNIASIVSSNLNLPLNAQRLVESGCDYLIVSADGATQEVYEKYRVGGSLQAVSDNVTAIVAAKKRAGRSNPVIEWQCLVSSHNEHLLGDVRAHARNLGANVVRFANLNFFSADEEASATGEWLPANPRYRSLAPSPPKPGAKRKPCFWLWRIALVNSDGGLTPCCLYDIPNWAEAGEGGLPAAWNSLPFKEARERSLASPPPHANSSICDRCTASFIYK